MSTVNIASPLRSYTHGAARVEARGLNLAEVLDDLEHHFPGIRFRMIDEQQHIRPHIRIFVNTCETRNLSAPLQPRDEVHLICSLSGG